MAYVPDPEDDHPGKIRGLLANMHGMGGLTAGESAKLIARTGLFGHCVDEMRIEGLLNGQG